MRSEGFSFNSGGLRVEPCSRLSVLQECPECPHKNIPQECPIYIGSVLIPVTISKQLSSSTVIGNWIDPSPTRVFHKSVPECHTRVSWTRVPYKSAAQECSTKVSDKSVPQDCCIRASDKSVLQDVPQKCPTRVSRMSVLQGFPTRVFRKTVPRK